MDLSVVIPVHDEEENVIRLFPAIEEACGPLGLRYEVIFVDDKSRDRTWERLCALEPTSAELVLIEFRRNAGQTPAMAAGFDAARGEIVISMDGDLQNDPSDIPAMLERCREGYDLVCGWRKHRKDKLLSRKLPSKCANWLIRRVTGVTVHDYGCSLKAYRRELLQRMRLYSDMHRFLPFLSQRFGARVGEMVVKHHARRFGVAKYGLSRIWKVLVDLLAMKVVVHYYRRMFYWFAFMAAPFFLFAAALLVAMFLAPPASRQVFLGGTVVLGSFALFTLMLGFVSDLVLKGDWSEFDQLLVHETRKGEDLK